MHPKLVGDITTAAVLTRLLEAYGNVSIPFGDNQRYDLLIDTGEGFLRVQCKTGRLRDGIVIFNACSSSYHHPSRGTKEFYNHVYRDQADVFAVYCPQTEDVYLVPVEDVGVSKGSIRVDPPANHQAKGIRWAKDHLVRGEPPLWAKRVRPAVAQATLFEPRARYACRRLVRRVSSMVEPRICNP